MFALDVPQPDPFGFTVERVVAAAKGQVGIGDDTTRQGIEEAWR